MEGRNDSEAPAANPRRGLARIRLHTPAGHIARLAIVITKGDQPLRRHRIERRG